jgi:hypothetical protein
VLGDILIALLSALPHRVVQKRQNRIPGRKRKVASIKNLKAAEIVKDIIFQHSSLVWSVKKILIGNEIF